MSNIGPIAYRDDESIHWIQITIADNGVCTEFKQASESDMATNTWKTLDPDQWPTIIPAYDPSVTQSNFVLSLDSENKLRRHFFSKYTPPGQDQSPIDRVSNQVYLGTYWGPMTMLRDPEKKSGLLDVYWQTEETQQAQLQTQYQRWQQSQVSILHHDATQQDLNVASQPLDFQTTQNDIAKPNIETDLVANQQWLVKSIIYDRLAIVKALNEANANMDKLVTLQDNVAERLLAKKIKAYFEEPESTQTEERFNSILPNRGKKNILAMHNASKFLAATLDELGLEHQTQFLIALLNQPQIPAYIAKQLFDDESRLEFKVILDVITALSLEKMALLVNRRNAMFFVRALLNKYKQNFSREPIEFLKQLPEEMLDKLMPQIKDDEIQIYLENYDLSLEELPKTNTTDWIQTAETISALFARTKTTTLFVEQLKMANSPRQMKELLLLEIRNGDYYQAENMVSIALKRLREHESAIMNSLAPDERRCRTQLKSSGELGKSLAIELECLQGDSRGAAKLNLLKEALGQLPEKITEAELHTLLRDASSPLCIALFTPVALISRGFTLFKKRKPPEPDMAFLNEIKIRLEQLDHGLAAGKSSQVSPTTR